MTQPKRILIVSHHALPHVGGVEVLVDREIRALADAGHRVVLVTSTTGGDGPEYPEAVTVVRVGAWHGLERYAHLAYPIFSPRLGWVLWREAGACDVLHAHGYIFLSSVVSLIVGRLRGKPCLLTDHGGIQRYHSRAVTVLARLAAETLGRLSCRLATRLVSFNLRVTHLLERLAGTRAKTCFLPNPVDYTLFHPPSPEQRRAARAKLGWEEGRPKILFVGRLIPDKGAQLLLEAVDPAYDVVICGAGDLSLLGTLPRPGVEYLPPRPQAELVALYQAADVFVLPSLREGFPLVVQEALACGLRVVMTDDPGYEPYRGLSRLCFCEREPRAIREAILQALVPEDSAAAQASAAALERLCPRTEVWIRRLYEEECPGDAAPAVPALAPCCTPIRS